VVMGEVIGVLLRVGGWIDGEKCIVGADAEDIMLGGRDGPRLCARSSWLAGSEGADAGGIGSMLD
jgi:hypothetical protein